MTLSTCPDIDQLARYAKCELVESTAELVSSHLEQCQACASAIEELESTDPIRRAILQQDAEFVGYESEQGCADTLKALATLTFGAREKHKVTTDRSPDPIQELPTIPGYMIEKVIAKGGMGIVYRATQVEADRTVALKQMLQTTPLSEEQTRRFKMEAVAAARLDHPSIVPVLDVGTHGDQPFFTMGYVEGQSLRAVLHEGPVDNFTAARWMAKISEAVAYAHDQGIIHRDLKPANVLLDQNDNPRVTDFGLAREVNSDSELTSSGQIMGTPSYMSPEQAGGETTKIGVGSDIYALGALLYALLTGRPPAQAATALDTLMQVIHEIPISPRALNPSVHRDLETICLKCLEKSPTNRYPSAAEVQKEFQRFLDGKPIVSRPVGVLEKAWRWCRRQPILSGLISAVALSLILGTTISLYFASLANERAERATERTQLALATLETIIETLQEKLRDIPGAHRIRRELLLSTLADLERIGDEAMLESRVDQNTANIYVDMGNLYYEIGDGKGGQALAASEEHLQRAVSIFESLTQDHSGVSEELLVDQARALNQWGDFLLNQKRLKQAEPPIRQSLAIRQRLHSQNPADQKIRIHLSRSLLTLADCLSLQGDRKQATVLAHRSLKLAGALFEEDPLHREYLNQVFNCRCALGDYAHDAGKHSEARKQFEAAAALLQTMADHRRNSFFYHDNRSFVAERMGNHHRALGQPQEALVWFEQMLASLNTASEMDPENRYIQEGLAVAYAKLASVHRALGNRKQASQARAKRDQIDAWLANSNE